MRGDAGLTTILRRMEVMMTLIRSQHGQESGYDLRAGSFQGWLWGVIRNRVRSVRRKDQKELAASPVAGPDTEVTDPKGLREVPQPLADFEQRERDQWQRALLATALRKVQERVTPDNFAIYTALLEEKATPEELGRNYWQRTKRRLCREAPLRKNPPGRGSAHSRLPGNTCVERSRQNDFMHPEPLRAQLPSADDLREISQTLSGLPAANDQLAERLQYIADLVANVGCLPAEPLLLWRETNRLVRHAVIGKELVVGRQSQACGLAFPEDKLLSRRHFVARTTGHECTLEDLKSHNGTALNRPDNRVRLEPLRDGDLIYAGSYVFAFLAPAALSGTDR
jgi:FHA domain-containing protein